MAADYDPDLLHCLRDNRVFLREYELGDCGDESWTLADWLYLAVAPEAGGSYERGAAAWALIDLANTERDGTGATARSIIANGGLTLDMAKRIYLERFLSDLPLSQLADLILSRGGGRGRLPDSSRGDEPPETRAELAEFAAQAIERADAQVERGLEVMALDARAWFVFRQRQCWDSGTGLPLMGVMSRRMALFQFQGQQPA